LDTWGFEGGKRNEQSSKKGLGNKETTLRAALAGQKVLKPQRGRSVEAWGKKYITIINSKGRGTPDKKEQN